MKPDGISLCMIVKNEAQVINRCLSTMAPLVEQMIVVDTGSTDDTVDLAQKAGATVIPFVWQHNTAQARNFSIEHADYEWIIILDADEIIAPGDFSAIRNLIPDNHNDGFTFLQRHYTDNPDVENWRANDNAYEQSRGFAGHFDVEVIRMFRNREQFRYTDHAHELVEASLKDRPKGRTGIPIHHYGIAHGRVSTDEKHKHYLSLLLADYQANPDSFKTNYLLGRQYHQLGDYAKSIQHLQQAISYNQTDASAYNCLGLSQLRIKQCAEAIASFEKAIALAPDYEEPYYSLGAAYVMQGDRKQALTALRQFISLNKSGVKGYNLIGYIYLQQNMGAMAEKYFRQALSIHPGYAVARGNLVHALIIKGDREAAQEEAKYLLEKHPDAKNLVNDLFESCRLS